MKSELLIDNKNSSNNNENQYENFILKTENNISSTFEKSYNIPLDSEESKKKGRNLGTNNEVNKITSQNEEKLINYNFNEADKKSKKSKTNKIMYNSDNLTQQKNIEFILNQKNENNVLNGFQTIKEKGNIFDKLKINKDLSLKNKTEFKKDNKKISFDNLNIKKMKEEKNANKSCDNYNLYKKNNKNNAYIRKINLKQNIKKENELLNQNNEYLFLDKNNIYNNGDNILNELQFSRNDIIKTKFHSQSTHPDSKLKEGCLIEKNEHTLTKNNSLLELLNQNYNNFSQLNRSFEIKNIINPLYSLNLYTNNINEDFLSGIKNEKRRNSLKNVISIYNRFKNHNNFQNKKLNNIIPLNFQINSKEKENEINKDKIKKEKEEINIDNDEENESEFSFNSNLKKTEIKSTEIKLDNYNNNNNDINKNKQSKDKNISLGRLVFEASQFKENKNDGFNNNNEKLINDNNNIVNENENNQMIINRKNEDNIYKEEDYINRINYKIKDDDKKDNKNEINDNKDKIVKKPSYFIRKLIREEHYYIDENGNEKLLEVKQKILNDEDSKKIDAPYIKKNVSLKTGLNPGRKKNKDNNLLDLSKLLNDEKKILNKDNTKKKDKKLNMKKNKINLFYNNKNDKNLEKKIKNALKAFQSNSPKLSSIKKNCFDKSSDMFKEFNYYFFKKEKNDSKIEDEEKMKYTTQNNINTPKHFNSPNKEKKSKKKDDIIFNKNNNNKFPMVFNSLKNLDNGKRLSNLIQASPKKNNQNNDASYNKLNSINKETESLKNLDCNAKDVKNKENNNKEKAFYIKEFNKLSNRDLNKNHHTFHEIKITKNKLSSNSESIFYPNDLSLDDTKSNSHIKKPYNFSIKSINYINKNEENVLNKKLNAQKLYNLNSTINKQKNFSLKSNSDSFFTINKRNLRRDSINNIGKKNHKYYESKSIKNKLNDFHYDINSYTDRNYTYSNSYLNKNNLTGKYKDNQKEKYFYQNWKNVNNNKE